MDITEANDTGGQRSLTTKKLGRERERTKAKPTKGETNDDYENGGTQGKSRKSKSSESTTVAITVS